MSAGHCCNCVIRGVCFNIVIQGNCCSNVIQGQCCNILLQQCDKRHDRHSLQAMPWGSLWGKTQSFCVGCRPWRWPSPLVSWTSGWQSHGSPACSGLTDHGESPVVCKPSEGKAVDFECLRQCVEDVALWLRSLEQKTQGAQPQGARILVKGHICKAGRVSAVIWCKSGGKFLCLSLG